VRRKELHNFYIHHILLDVQFSEDEMGDNVTRMGETKKHTQFILGKPQGEKTTRDM